MSPQSVTNYSDTGVSLAFWVPPVWDPGSIKAIAGSWGWCIFTNMRLMLKWRETETFLIWLRFRFWVITFPFLLTKSSFERCALLPASLFPYLLSILLLRLAWVSRGIWSSCSWHTEGCTWDDTGEQKRTNQYTAVQSSIKRVEDCSIGSGMWRPRGAP